jgi:hypothetical protein
MENKINLSLDKTTAISCGNSSCSNEVFIEGVMLRKASRFLTGTDRDAMIPISVMICSKCGEVLEETIPVALKNQDND